jgi:hypothetical protein
VAKKDWKKVLQIRKLILYFAPLFEKTTFLKRLKKE